MRATVALLIRPSQYDCGKVRAIEQTLVTGLDADARARAVMSFAVDKVVLE
jgi:hypothetical protein